MKNINKKKWYKYEKCVGIYVLRKKDLKGFLKK